MITTKVESKLKKLIRRAVQQVKPLHCSVRYDSDAKQWAVLDANDEPSRHFNHGVLTNVTFRSEPSNGHYGCGPRPFIGIATGDLVENTHGAPEMGYQNLKFGDSGFATMDGKPIKEARVVRLMANRAAVYLS